jgi:hypothetical protein
MKAKEFIELYNKVGGILTIDYRNNTMDVKDSRLYCKFDNTEYKDIEYFIGDFVFSPYSVEVILDKNVCNDYIKQKNRFLNEYECGYIIIVSPV